MVGVLDAPNLAGFKIFQYALQPPVIRFSEKHWRTTHNKLQFYQPNIPQKIQVNTQGFKSCHEKYKIAHIKRVSKCIKMDRVKQCSAVIKHNHNILQKDFQKGQGHHMCSLMASSTFMKLNSLWIRPWKGQVGKLIKENLPSGDTLTPTGKWAGSPTDVSPDWINTINAQ